MKYQVSHFKPGPFVDRNLTLKGHHLSISIFWQDDKLLPSTTSSTWSPASTFWSYRTCFTRDKSRPALLSKRSPGPSRPGSSFGMSLSKSTAASYQLFSVPRVAEKEPFWKSFHEELRGLREGKFCSTAFQCPCACFRWDPMIFLLPYRRICFTRTHFM